MIAYVTDSTGMLDASRANDWGVEVVPIQITIDGRTYSDGVDLSVDEYYRLVGEGAENISTSQPSPGTFSSVYEDLAERGATEIHSVHVGAALSGTLNSARLGAEDCAVPVHLYDTGTSSFGVAMALRAVIDSVDSGGNAEIATMAMQQRLSNLGTAFFMDRPQLEERGIESVVASPSPQTIWTMTEGALDSLGEAASFTEAAEMMLSAAFAATKRVHIAVGIGDQDNEGFVQLIDHAVKSNPLVASVTHYRVGPSVAASLGPNTGGLFWYPEASGA